MPTHYQGDPKTKLALDTFIKVTRASSALQNRLFLPEILGGLTPSQFGVMETLFHLGPLCQGEISSRLLLSSSNITFVLDNLEKAGYVKRERDTNDRRMVMLYLTPEGEELIRKVFPQVAEKVKSEMDYLTEIEQQFLGQLCKKLGTRKA